MAEGSAKKGDPRKDTPRNKLLEKAIAEAALLPDDQQATLGSLLLDEIEAEKAWNERFAVSEDQLGEIVSRAKEEVARGGVLPFDSSDRPAG